MKFITALVFILPFFAVAQDSIAVDCKLSKDLDPYTRETRLSTGFISLQGGASLTIDADSKEIDFFFVVPDKCFADASTVFIFFEGSKTKTTYRNSGSVNCDGNFHFVYRNQTLPNTVLKKLASQKVAHFIFTGTDGKATTVGLLPAQQEMLMQKTACMIDQAQTLIRQ
jgi:hypothetical protein